MLQAVGIAKSYRSGTSEVQALKDDDLDIYAGEFISFVGPSGCGKTTLLRIIDGLTDQTLGRIVFNGAELTGVSPEMGYVFQDINLLPWRSVRENVEIGLEARRMPAARRAQRAREVLEMGGLADVAERPPYTLSGGMQQRVGVARALAIDPKVLLMDEPFGHLDNFTRENLQVEVARLWQSLKMTVVFVTHDVDEAIFLSDRIALFRTNPGRMSQLIAVNLKRPRWEYNVRADPEYIRMREVIMDELEVRKLQMV